VLDYVGLCSKIGERGGSKARQGKKRGVPSQRPCPLLIQRIVLRMVDNHIATWGKNSSLWCRAGCFRLIIDTDTNTQTRTRMYTHNLPNNKYMPTLMCDCNPKLCSHIHSTASAAIPPREKDKAACEQHRTHVLCPPATTTSNASTRLNHPSLRLPPLLCMNHQQAGLPACGGVCISPVSSLCKCTYVDYVARRYVLHVYGTKKKTKDKTNQENHAERKKKTPTPKNTRPGSHVLRNERTRGRRKKKSAGYRYSEPRKPLVWMVMYVVASGDVGIVWRTGYTEPTGAASEAIKRVC